MMRILILLVIMSFSCPIALGATDPMDHIAERYVKLALSFGQIDKDYVDAYFGPEEWKKEASEKNTPLAEIQRSADELQSELLKLKSKYKTKELKDRFDFLAMQIKSFHARINLVSGKKISFNEESKALYDVVAPTHPDSYFEKHLKKLDQNLPGTGTPQERLQQFRDKYAIPKDKLEAVMKRAIDECRTKTKKYVALPENEFFSLKLVSGKSWNAYNWYQGNFKSLIEVNTDKPTSPEKVLDLAAHEGYPGHHVLNTLLEQKFLKTKNWIEFSIYPLFSPQSFIAEGTAVLAKDIAFPKKERAEFLEKVVFPMSGFDPKEVKSYLETLTLLENIRIVSVEAARRYLDGKMTREQTIAWLKKYNLDNDKLAELNIKFYDTYRSYIVNYSLGKQILGDHLKKQVGTQPSGKKLWTAFLKLLEFPKAPSSY